MWASSPEWAPPQYGWTPPLGTGQSQTPYEIPSGYEWPLLYRGQMDETGPGERHLPTRQRHTLAPDERPTPAMAPFEFWSESPEVAQRYADTDQRILAELRAFDSAERALEQFRWRYGRDPRPAGSVQQHLVPVRRYLDLTDLGPAPAPEVLGARLQSALGLGPDEPYQRFGLWDRAVREGEGFPVYRLTRGDRGYYPNAGADFADLLARRGYDALRYAENGGTNWAVLQPAPRTLPGVVPRIPGPMGLIPDLLPAIQWAAENGPQFQQAPGVMFPFPVPQDWVPPERRPYRPPLPTQDEWERERSDWVPIGGGQARMPLGSGADRNPPESDEEVRRQYWPDPGRRLQEVQQRWQQTPWQAAAETAMLPFEALSLPIRYGAGVIQGGTQHLAQRYGWDMPGRVATRFAEAPDIPVIGGLTAVGGLAAETAGTIAGTGRDLLTGQAPPYRPLPYEQRVLDQGDWSDQRYRLVPEADTLESILDPGSALGRYAALTPVPAQLGIEMASGTLPARAAAVPLRLMASTLGAPAQALGQALRTPQAIKHLGAAGIVEQVADTIAGPTAQRVLRLGVPAVATVGGAIEGLRQPTETGEPNLLAGAIIGGTTGLAAALAGGSVASWGRAVQQHTTTLGRIPPPPPGFTRSPQMQAVDTELERNARVIEGRLTGMTTVPTIPGGALGETYDGWQRALIDRLARLNTQEGWGEQLAVSQLARALFDDERPALQGRLLGGVGKQFGYWASHEVGGILDTAQVTNADIVRFDRLRAALLFTDDAARGVFRGPFKTLADARQHLAELRAEYAATPGIGAAKVARWEQGARELTQSFNDFLLEPAVETGLISRQAAQQMIAQRPVYMVLQDVVDEQARLFPTKDASGTLAAGTSDIGRAHDSEALPYFGLGADLLRGERMMAHAQQARVMRALGTLSDTFPNEVGTYIQRVRDTAGNPLTIAPGKYAPDTVPVPQGMGVLPVPRDGVLDIYMAPKYFVEEMRGLTSVQADSLSTFMSNLTGVFRKGVTVWSVPFLPRNFTRDIQAVLHNYDHPGLLLSNILPAAFDLITNDWAHWAQRNPQASQGLTDRIIRALRTNIVGHAAPYAPGTIGEMAQARGLGATITENMTRMPTGVAPTRDEVLRLTGIASGHGVAENVLRAANPANLITKPIQLLETLNEFAEIIPRLATYRSEIQRGRTPTQGAFAGRNITVDFYRGGDVAKIANLWFPLLNARVQGTLRTGKAALENPYEFGMRLHVTTVLPTLATYAWNHLIFGHLYDQVPQDERDRHHIIMYGGYTGDLEKEQPLYLRIPRDEWGALVGLPLEHLMDQMLHTRRGERTLDPINRTERDWPTLMLQSLARLAPFNWNGDSFENPIELIAGAFALNPIYGVVSQVQANRDLFRNRPIIPEDIKRLDPQFWANPRTPKGYRMIGQLLREAGVPEGWREDLAPANLEFAVRGLGGTAAAMLFQGAGDLVYGALDRAGMIPPNAFQPTRPSDFRIPADAPPALKDKLLGAIQREDLRPWPAVHLSAIIGSAGGAQTIRAKVTNGLTPESARIYADTTEAGKAQDLARAEFDRKTWELFREPGTLTADQLRMRYDDLRQQYWGQREQILTDHPNAAKTPSQRAAFLRTLPGLPVDAYLQRQPTLPPGWTPQMIYDRAHPEMPFPNSMAKFQYGQTEYRKMANETGLPISVLETYAAATLLGKELPALGIPALYYEEAVDRWLRPRDAAGNVLPSNIVPENRRRAQRVELERMASDWQVPADQLLEWINTRLANPWDQHERLRSLERARNLRIKITEPERFPLFTNAQGTPLGDPSQHPAWEQELARWGAIPRAQRPPVIQQLDDAYRWGTAKREWALRTDPDYVDYARWFGVGRTLTENEWAEFSSGARPRYTTPGLTMTQQLARDNMLAVYDAMPESPERQRLRPFVSEWRRQRTPGWARAMDAATALEREAEAQRLGVAPSALARVETPE